jgi:hypothetical protein
MMKLFDAPRLLLALVVFFERGFARSSADPPPLGLPPRLPRDPDANAPLESRATHAARAVAIVALLHTDQREADSGRRVAISAFLFGTLRKKGRDQILLMKIQAECTFVVRASALPSSTA